MSSNLRVRLNALEPANFLAISSRGMIAVQAPGRGEDDLPELGSAGSERTGTGEQVIFPHAVETFIVGRSRQLLEASVEIVEPVHQRGVIIGPKTVPVLYDK